MAGHFIEFCSCGIILSQCQCQSTEKVYRVSRELCSHSPQRTNRPASAQKRRSSMATTSANNRTTTTNTDEIERAMEWK